MIRTLAALGVALSFSACPANSPPPPPAVIPAAPTGPKLTAELRAQFDALGDKPCRKSATGPEWLQCGVISNSVEVAARPDTTLRRVIVSGLVTDVAGASAHIERVAGSLLKPEQLTAIREAIQTPELLTTGQMLTVRSAGGVYLLTLQRLDAGEPRLWFQFEIVYDEK